MKLETKIRFESGTASRLKALSDRYGYSVAALVRACVDGFLDQLEQVLRRENPDA